MKAIYFLNSYFIYGYEGLGRMIALLVKRLLSSSVCPFFLFLTFKMRGEIFEPIFFMPNRQVKKSWANQTRPPFTHGLAVWIEEAWVSQRYIDIKAPELWRRVASLSLWVLLSLTVDLSSAKKYQTWEGPISTSHISLIRVVYSWYSQHNKRYYNTHQNSNTAECQHEW